MRTALRVLCIVILSPVIVPVAALWCFGAAVITLVNVAVVVLMFAIDGEWTNNWWWNWLDEF